LAYRGLGLRLTSVLYCKKCSESHWPWFHWTSIGSAVMPSMQNQSQKFVMPKNKKPKWWPSGRKYPANFRHDFECQA